MILFYVQMLEKFTHHLHFKQDQDPPPSPTALQQEKWSCMKTIDMLLER